MDSKIDKVNDYVKFVILKNELQIIFFQGSSYSNGLDIMTESTLPAGANIDDVVEKYKEAITHYSKVICFTLTF